MTDEKEARQCWETPQDFFDMMDREFAFDIDVACNKHNAKSTFGIYEHQDAMSTPWFYSDTYGEDFSAAWCNPPYKNPLQWIERAYQQTHANPGTVCVMLLNHDASTQWYSKALRYASEIRILTNKRIQFIAPDGVKASSNAKAQCVIVFRRKLESAPCHVWHWDWQKDL